MKKMLPFIVIFLLLLLPLLVMESRSSLIIIMNIAIMGIFAMSYDILLGYTGIVSFGHVMYFGIGAFTTAMMMKRVGDDLLTLILSLLIVFLITLLLSLILGSFTQRIKSHFFAMLTLAVAELIAVMAEKWKEMTGGADGFSFTVPDFLKDKLLFTYITIFMMLITYYLLRRFTLSPVGRILVGIRENEQRMEALGYPVLRYKLIASAVAGTVAGFAGVLYSIGMRFVSVPSVLGVDITLNALLMTIVGGVGTLIGAIMGAGVIEVISQWLQGLSKEIPLLERWLLFIGLAYILIVRFFPRGIVGSFYQIKQKIMERKNSISFDEANSMENKKAEESSS